MAALLDFCLESLWHQCPVDMWKNLVRENYLVDLFFSWSPKVVTVTAVILAFLAVPRDSVIFGLLVTNAINLI